MPSKKDFPVWEYREDLEVRKGKTFCSEHENLFGAKGKKNEGTLKYSMEILHSFSHTLRSVSNKCYITAVLNSTVKYSFSNKLSVLLSCYQSLHYLHERREKKKKGKIKFPLKLVVKP